MSHCTHCGKELSLPRDDKCNYCHDLENHLPKFLSTGAGRSFTAQAMRDAERLVAEREAAAKKVKRDARINDYKELGIAELRLKIARSEGLLNQMVGNLYPSVVEKDLDEMREALQELEWQ